MHARTLATLTLCVTVAACGGKEAAVDTGARTDSGAVPTTPTATTEPAAPALTDPNIVFILDQANAADSVRGRLASTKGTNADVKAFGRLMMGEHHALRAQGRTLAAKLGVTPTAPAGDQSEAQAKQELDSLNALAAGAAWDRAYIDYEVTYHEEVLKTATAALGAAQNAELKALIEQAAPVIQKHLDRAKEIQQKLRT